MTHHLSRRNLLKAAIPFGAMGLLGSRVWAEPEDTVEPDGVRHGRIVPQSEMPLVDCQGTPFECGEMLGNLWKSALAMEASLAKGGPPWWRSPQYVPLVEKYCPHLPDIYRGMARAAGVSEDVLGAQLASDAAGGCTSFALAPEATLEGIPISGQNKDVSAARAQEMIVLRLKMTGAPSLLAVTYTGSIWLYGHGFVQGGTAIFRNSLYVEWSTKGMPYMAWGLVAMHCPTVDDVIEMTKRYGVQEAFHVVVADQRGGIVGIEGGRDGFAFLRPEQSIYAHANAVVSDGPLRATEKDTGAFRRAESVHREKRLVEQFTADRGRLTAPLAYRALCDHDGYPVSTCRHQSPEVRTGAAIIAEPTRGLLHVTRGAPCQHWPRTYSIS